MVKCTDCFWLGYFRVEHARGSGTTFFDPETLPENGRHLLSNNSSEEFVSYIESLNAKDHKIACLRENTSGGQRNSIEPKYDVLNVKTEFDKIASLACITRNCNSANLFDPYISFEDAKLLNQKQRITNVVEGIENRKRKAQYENLLKQFLQIEIDYKANPQKRGKVFEIWLSQFFSASGLIPDIDIKNSWEQIDFTFLLDSYFIIGESRWLKDAVDTKQVRDFFGKLTDRPPFVIGLIISIGGFTEPATEWVDSRSNERTTLLLDGKELINIMQNINDFKGLLLGKIKHKLEHPRK